MWERDAICGVWGLQVVFPGPVWTGSASLAKLAVYTLERVAWSRIPGPVAGQWITWFLVSDADSKSNRILCLEYCQVWLKDFFCRLVGGEPEKLEHWDFKFTKWIDVLFCAGLLVNVV